MHTAWVRMGRSRPARNPRRVKVSPRIWVGGLTKASELMVVVYSCTLFRDTLRGVYPT